MERREEMEEAEGATGGEEGDGETYDLEQNGWKEF